MPVLSSLVGQHFAYAAGRTGVLQQLLLTTSDRDRLLGAKDIKEAEAILTELKLTNPIDQGLKKGDEILQAVGSWVRSEVEMMVPAAKLPTFSILWMESDLPLIAYLLKEHFGLTSVISTRPSAAMCSYSVESLNALINEDVEGSLPSHLVAFVRKAKQMVAPLPQEVDSAVAQYIASMQLSLARSSGSPLIKRYVRNKIDVLNIRTALRLQGSSVATKDHLISGGNIDPSKLTGNLQSILAAVDTSPLPYELSEGIRKGIEDTNVLEQALSHVLAEDIANMWNIPLSIEPVFAFAALAQTQLTLLRVLLIGKRAAMSPQEIKHLLPPFLSASHYLI